MRKKKLASKVVEPLKPVKPNAAGIDIGSEEIFVCVPEDRDPDFVRSFPTFTADLVALTKWLIACGIETIAIEATGVYWIPLFEILEEFGLEVFLVSPHSLKRQKKRMFSIASGSNKCIATECSMHHSGLKTKSVLYVPTSDTAKISSP